MPNSSNTHYVTILSQTLAAKKRRNPRYSLRAFAKHLGMDPSSLSRILSGKQELSVPACHRLIQKLDLDSMQKRRFVSSVAEAKINRATCSLSDEVARFSMDESRQWFEMAHDAILVLDPKGEQVLDVNAHACQIYGFSREEFIGKSMAEFFDTPNEFERLHVETINQGGRFLSFEMIHLNHRGERVLFDINASVVQYQGKDAILSINRDVTERKRMEHRQRFLADAGKILGSSLEGVTTFESLARAAVSHQITDGFVIHVSEDTHSSERFEIAHRHPELEQRIYSLLRGQPSSMNRLYSLTRISEDGMPLLLPHLTEEGLALLASSPDELRELKALKVRSLICAPLVVRGRLIGMITFVRSDSMYLFNDGDKELARELAVRVATAIDNRRLFADALRAVRDRDDFMAVVSHDLRSPLTGILHGSDVLLRVAEQEVMDSSVNQASLIKRGLEAIHSSAERMHHLVNGIVSLAKVQSGTAGVQLAEESMQSLLVEAVGASQSVASKKGVRIVCDHGQEDWSVFCDREQVFRVFSNLITNAVKFSPDNGVVQVEASVQESDVRFAIRDQGCGIEADHLPRIFDRFWQAQSGFSLGAGLGLSIAHEIVKAHGGKIWAESGSGQGSAFFFTLPLASSRKVSVA